MTSGTKGSKGLTRSNTRKLMAGVCLESEYTGKSALKWKTTSAVLTCSVTRLLTWRVLSFPFYVWIMCNKLYGRSGSTKRCCLCLGRYAQRNTDGKVHWHMAIPEWIWGQRFRLILVRALLFTLGCTRRAKHLPLHSHSRKRCQDGRPTYRRRRGCHLSLSHLPVQPSPLLRAPRQKLSMLRRF